ncbi:hypothetical protein C0J52_21554 [Blattella germanica]|nr:hypothetical protein C0J52_21554 [Blattella germanica]
MEGNCITKAVTRRVCPIELCSRATMWSCKVSAAKVPLASSVVVDVSLSQESNPLFATFHMC